jgi:hypothetical protein
MMNSDLPKRRRLHTSLRFWGRRTYKSISLLKDWKDAKRAQRKDNAEIGTGVRWAGE